jgi:ribonuclease P protein component
MDRTTEVAAADRNAPRAMPDRAASGVSGAALVTLRKRADFLRAASARRQGMPGFLLQARNRRRTKPIRRSASAIPVRKSWAMR